MWGAINHFDFQALFDNDFPFIMEFHRNKSLQRNMECPFNDAAGGLPDRWHEGHEPSVRFLTADEDRQFNPRG